MTPNFSTSSSSLLSTLLTATFSYCSMSSATCKASSPSVRSGGSGTPSLTRDAAGPFSTLYNTSCLQSGVRANQGGCWEGTFLPKAPRSYLAPRTWASRETGDKYSCTHLSAHKGVALLKDQCQVPVLVPLEEAANLFRAAREKRMMAAGALASAGCSALLPKRSLAFIPGDSAGDADAGSAPLSGQFFPAEVSSPIFCSSSQALRKLTRVSQGGRKQSTGRAGQEGAARLPAWKKNSNELELGLLFVFFFFARTRRHWRPKAQPQPDHCFRKAKYSPWDNHVNGFSPARSSASPWNMGDAAAAPCSFLGHDFPRNWLLVGQGLLELPPHHAAPTSPAPVEDRRVARRPGFAPGW